MNTLSADGKSPESSDHCKKTIFHETPAWLVSLIVHFILLIVLALAMAGRSIAPSLPLALELLDAAEEELDPGGSSFVGELSLGKENAAAPPSRLLPPALPLEQVLFDATVTDPFNTVATELAASVADDLQSIMSASAAGGSVRDSGLGRGRGGGIGSGTGKGRANLFGAEGEGYKFVYVLDRSASMNENDHDLLFLAKKEVCASLENLRPNHEFQVILYNQEPLMFNPRRGADQFIRATKYNKIRMQRFLESVYAFDGTDHLKAMLRAVRMHPDVIFLWTDANFPQLGRLELEQILIEADGIVINTVEIGYGPQADPDNFLVELARRSGGQHVYLDINKIFPPDR